jgi:hypothetical protein
MTVRTYRGVAMKEDLWADCIGYASAITEYRTALDRLQAIEHEQMMRRSRILAAMVAADRHAIRVSTVPETILLRTEEDDLDVLSPVSPFEVERLAAARPQQPDDDAITEAAFHEAIVDVFGGTLLDEEVE